MALFAQTLALFLALVLAVAAVHKVTRRDRLAAATGKLLGLQPPLGLPVMLAAAAVEAAAAIALVFAASRPAGALLAALLWALYGILLAGARRRGEGGIDCGCSLAARHAGIGMFAVTRAFALAAAAFGLAALCLLAGVEPVAAAAAGVESLFAALALFTLLLAAGELAELPWPLRSSIR